MSSQVTNNRRSKNRNERGQRILDAAQVLFREKSFEFTTTKEIAEAANVSEPTIFNHFGSKSNILIRIIQRGDAELQHEIDELIDSASDDIYKEMTAMMSLIIDWSLRHVDERSWRHAMSISISDCDGDVGSIYRQQNKKLYDNCTRLMILWSERGVVDPNADFLTARDLFERLNHSVYEDFVTRKIPDLTACKAIMESYVRLILSNTFSK